MDAGSDSAAASSSAAPLPAGKALPIRPSRSTARCRRTYFRPARSAVVCQRFLQQKIFWRGLIISVPSGVLTYSWVSLEGSEIADRLAIHSTAFSSFTFLISVFVAFRASQAYSRFWDGTCGLFQLRGHFIDVVSSLFAFSRLSTARPEDVREFRHKVVRLFSMLETLCLADLSVEGLIDGSEDAFAFAIIDPTYFSEETITAIRQSEYPIDLIVQWLQSLIVEAMSSNIIVAAPPICTRVFQELQSGLSSFRFALTISEVPIPFPYTAATRLVFVLFWLMMPLAASNWSDSSGLCGVMATCQVFALYILNSVAGEMENPFGSDVNDLDVEHGHLEFNHRLSLLLTPSTQMMPMRAPHVENATTHCPYEILGRQLTLADVFGSEPKAKSKQLFRHSRRSETSSASLSDDKLDVSEHNMVSLDATGIASNGTDVLISDERSPVTQMPETQSSELVIGQHQPCDLLHDSEHRSEDGIDSKGHTSGSSDVIGIISARISKLHDRQTPVDECIKSVIGD